MITIASKHPWLAANALLILVVSGILVLASPHYTRSAKAATPVVSAANAPLSRRYPRPLGLGLPSNLNPQINLLSKVQKQGNTCAPLTSILTPTKFDPVAFAKDAAPYLSTVEPGRVWDVADPADGVPGLSPKSDELLDVAKQGTVELAVVGVPRAPVTFTSFDLGHFENQLTSVTVQADAQGVAAVHFTAGDGVSGKVRVSAGSPLTCGRVNFIVSIAP